MQTTTRRSAQAWREVVTRFAQSGLTEEAFCEREGGWSEVISPVAIQAAAGLPALAFFGDLVCWLIVTNAGKHHKRKELAGHGRALSFTRDSRGFHIRSGAKKPCPIIDSKFNSADGAVLTHTGLAEIFFPDGLDKLVEDF